MIHVIAANQHLHWLRLFHDITSEKSPILFVQPAMLKNRTILSLDQRIEVLCRLGEAHHVERLLPSQCDKTQMARMISKQRRKATEAYIEYKHSPTLPQLLCRINVRFTTIIAYLITTIRVFIRNIAGGENSSRGLGSIARCIIFGVPRLPIRPCDERPPAMYGHFCLVPRVSVHDRYYCRYIIVCRRATSVFASHINIFFLETCVVCWELHPPLCTFKRCIHNNFLLRYRRISL